MAQNNKLLRTEIAQENKFLRTVMALKNKLFKSILSQAALNLRTSCIKSKIGTHRHQHQYTYATLRYKILHNQGAEFTVHKYVQFLSHSATLPEALKHAIQTPNCSRCKDVALFINLLKPTGNFTCQKFNIQKFYIVIIWNLCIFYGSRK